MAQYTYRCASCATEFDRIIQPKYRDDWQICPNPKCGGDSYRLKIPTGTTFNCVGDGFYHQGMPKKS